jgi:hypothetical protein
VSPAAVPVASAREGDHEDDDEDDHEHADDREERSGHDASTHQ